MHLKDQPSCISPLPKRMHIVPLTENLRYLADLHRQRVQAHPNRTDPLLAFFRLHRLHASGLLLLSGESLRFVATMKEIASIFVESIPAFLRADIPLSRLTPIYDVAAFGTMAQLEALAPLQTIAHRPDVEYPEDYGFIHTLIGIAALVARKPRSDWIENAHNAILDSENWRHFESAGMPIDDLRVDFCRGLLGGNPLAFRSALDEFLDTRYTRLKRLSASDLLAPEEEIIGMHFCMEGLSMLSLARSLGIPAGHHYRTLPEVLTTVIPDRIK